jgi:hypothetical protein
VRQTLSIEARSVQAHPRGVILEIRISGDLEDARSAKRLYEFVRRTMEEQDPAAVVFSVLECKGHYAYKKVAGAVMWGCCGRKRPCVIVGTSRVAREALEALTWGEPIDLIQHFRRLQDGIAHLKTQLESGDP